jgi:aryl-alcohol dehydrogenase-like predicted oxidoreductase
MQPAGASSLSSDSPVLCLGTAQLGLPYGLGAAAGGLSASQVDDILTAAAAEGIDFFDTAAAYGDSEVRIGRWRAARPDRERLRIVTKIPALEGRGAAAAADSFRRSRDALGVARVEAVLTHRATDILEPDVAESLRGFVAQRSARTFGASVYTVEQARAALAVPGIGTLQVPANLLDRTAFTSGLVRDAAAQGVAVHVRSIFLQGILLGTPEALPEFLGEGAACLRALAAAAARAGRTMAEMALADVAGEAGVAALVVGVDTPGQLRDVAAAFARVRRDPVPPEVLGELRGIAATFPRGLVDPRQWRR